MRLSRMDQRLNRGRAKRGRGALLEVISIRWSRIWVTNRRRGSGLPIHRSRHRQLNRCESALHSDRIRRWSWSVNGRSPWNGCHTHGRVALRLGNHRRGAIHGRWSWTGRCADCRTSAWLRSRQLRTIDRRGRWSKRSLSELSHPGLRSRWLGAIRGRRRNPLHRHWIGPVRSRCVHSSNVRSVILLERWRGQHRNRSRRNAPLLKNLVPHDGIHNPPQRSL